MSKEDELWEMIEEAKEEGLEDFDIKVMLLTRNIKMINKFNETDLIKAMSGIDNMAFFRYNNRQKLSDKMREVIDERIEKQKTVLDEPHSVFRRIKGDQ